MHDGAPLTSELLRARIREVCARAGCPAPPDIIAAPMRAGDPVGHDNGAGPLPAHAPICIDLWPQDEASGCWADMTRTYVRGDVSDAVAELRRLVLDSHEQACAAVRPGVTGRALYDVACDVIEAAGYRHPAQRDARRGRCATASRSASATASGSRSTRRPGSGLAGDSELVAGDVVAVEPGVIDLERGVDARRGPARS